MSTLLLAGALNPALAIGEFNPGAGASVTASTPPSIPNPTAPGGLSAFEGLLIFAPVILYGLFTVYRSKVNERAKVRSARFSQILYFDCQLPLIICSFLVVCQLYIIMSGTIVQV